MCDLGLHACEPTFNLSLFLGLSCHTYILGKLIHTYGFICYTYVDVFQIYTELSPELQVGEPVKQYEEKKIAF